MIETNKKISELNKTLLKAKKLQAELVSSHGNNLTKDERQKIVTVWGTLDISCHAVREIMQQRKIK
jgi:hypothetical protein